MTCFVNRRHLVEPVMFLYMLALYLQYPAIQALIYSRICSQKYNETICSHLKNSTYKIEENWVQKETSHWILYISLSLLIPSIFSAIVLGRVGDTISRKYAILSPIFGQFLCSILYVVNAVYVNISPLYLLIGPLMSGFFGGFTSLIMAVYSYVSHTTEVKSRTVRMGILESMTFFAGTLGVLLVGVLLDHFGFIAVFGIIFILNCFAMVYTLFFIDDITTECVSPKLQIVCYVFTKEGVKDFVKVFRRTREGHKKSIMVLGTLIICILMFITGGDIDLSFLYLSHSPLSFSKSYISYYLGWENCMKALPLVTLLPLFKRIFTINDCFWGILGILSKCLGGVLFGLSHVTWLIFCVPLVKLFQSFPSAVIRSLLSTTVENTEQGQLFAVVACTESIFTLLSSLTFNTLYSATVDFNPGISFFVSSAIGVIAIILVLITWRISTKSFKYKLLAENTENTGQRDEIVDP